MPPDEFCEPAVVDDGGCCWDCGGANGPRDVWICNGFGIAIVRGTVAGRNDLVQYSVQFFFSEGIDGINFKTMKQMVFCISVIISNDSNV